MKFRTTLLQAEKNATGIEVPPEAVESRCNRIDREERAIRHRYGADKAVVDAVNEAFGLEF